jgi:hypothetical protein
LEIFKFNPPVGGPTYFQSGEVVNGADSKMWVERYRDPGEFSLSGNLSAGLREQLPVGTFISHNNTLEVMVVENHQIVEDRSSDPTIQVTGRSFETMLEQRIVGVNQIDGTAHTLSEYVLAADYTWNQAVTLINEHISTADVADPNDALGSVIAAASVSGASVETEFVVGRDNVHAKLLSVLELEDLGIRTIRRNTFGLLGSATNTTLLVHAGSDKRNSVVFSWVSGDLESAEYLWSNKKHKNCAVVFGTYVGTKVYSADVGSNRRVMYVDATDLDDYLSAPPIGGNLTSILSKMAKRGRVALAAQKEVNLVRADTSNVTNYQYRRDYEVGDYVTVQGNRGETATMRVTEYVEIEDENGESGHPTLSVIDS